MKNLIFHSLLFVVLTSIIFEKSANAQQFYFNTVSEYKTHLGLRYLRPMIKGEKLSGLSGTWELNALQSIGRASLIVSIPYSSISYGQNYSESSLGNLFLGLQFPSENKKTHFTLGFALPTASKEKWEAADMGAYSDFLNYYKYLPQTMTLYGNIAYHSVFSDKIIFAVEAGPNVTIPTEKGDPQLFLHYGLQGGLLLNKLSILTEFYGLAIISENELSLAERTFHNITVGAHYDFGRIEPGIFYSQYLDHDLSDISILGFQLDYKIN
jgi:hypothetical protein